MEIVPTKPDTEDSQPIWKTPHGGYLKPFVKGQSGNPKGRSGKYWALTALAREASPKALKRLIELIDSDDERVASVASNAVLDRAWGKPKEDKGEDDKQIRPNISGLDDMELAALRALLSKALSPATQDVVQPSDIGEAPKE